jgi:predicted metal-dependent phosphotriesterase family hydrolase
LENIVPRMRRKRFAEEQIQAITVDNPARLLSFV